MGYHLNRLDEPVFTAVPKPLQTEFSINYRLESCGKLSSKFKRMCSTHTVYDGNEIQALFLVSPSNWRG